jgi:hypothetical protein
LRTGQESGQVACGGGLTHGRHQAREYHYIR